MRVDAHVHIWDAAVPPHPDHPLPKLTATPAHLLANMDAARVDKALLVQPINYKFDHSFLQATIAQHPTRFAGVALADTTMSPADATQALQSLVASGFRGIRINPTFTPAAFASQTVTALLRTSADLSIPVALFARPDHLDELAALLTACPNTRVVLDHFAFASTATHVPAQRTVLSLGRQFPNLFVKMSAWFRISVTPWPHADLRSYVRELVDAFGPDRLLFGSDYPFVTENYDYTKAYSVLAASGLSPDERRWIAGDSAVRLYNLN